MLSQTKWLRTGLVALMVVASLSGIALAKKPTPPPDPEPEPDPPPVTYTITWLDDFQSNYVNAINSHGQAVGLGESPELCGGEPFAYLYTPATGMVDLHTLLPAGHDWYLRNANDINDQGQIVGYGFRAGSDKGRGWRYTPALLDDDGNELMPAVIEEIAAPSDTDQKTVASRINEQGEVAGNTVDANRVSHVWFFSDEVGLIPLEVGGDKARGLNESSQILVGGSGTTIRVFPLGEPEFFDDVYGQAINDIGEFVGSISVEVPINKKRTTTVTRAIRHDGVTPLDLGAGDNSCAYGINNHGDVVGTLETDLDTRGFVYLEEFQQLVRLDDAVVGDPIDVARWFDPGIQTHPTETNNIGQISGELSTRIGFILTPVPAD
jgi:probable HAF family extracellular repeat protein